MNKILGIFVTLSMLLSLTSCLEDKPLTESPNQEEPLGPPETLANMQNSFVKATNGLTPMKMGKNEWALFRIKAKLYDQPFQGLGYRAAQVISASNDKITVENKDYWTRNLNIVITDYKEPVNGNDPEVELQKEWACKFVQPPYYLWYNECTLPPEQNAWVFNGYEEPTNPIFFSLAKYTQKEKLPQKLIDENRCYNFENCEIDVNYLEYDIYGIDANGEGKRFHYITSFSGELPYLASNLKTCYTTIVNMDGLKHPAEICQEVVNFQPGDAAPNECQPDTSQPCE